MKTKYLIPLAAIALFCACKGKGGGYEVVNNSGGSSSSADSDTSRKADTSTSPKLVKTAGMSFKVKNVNQTAIRIDGLTTGFGGMVVHQQMGSSVQGSHDVRISTDSVMRITSLTTTAELTVKVPSVRLEKFMDSVASMGMFVTNRNLNITDKTLDYMSAQLKLKSRDELVKQQKAGKIIIKDPAKVLDLKDDMIDQQIGNRQIDDAVKNSIVNLSFYQSNTINKEVIVNDDPSAYDLPFFKRLLMACENGWSLCLDIIIGLANVWFLIAVGGLVWYGIRQYSKSKKAIGMVKD
jgi:hypothetical protein